MITLFQLFTLDQWYKIYNDLTKVSNVAFTCTYILLWVWIGSFVFRNLFVGIMGEYASFGNFSIRKMLQILILYPLVTNSYNGIEHSTLYHFCVLIVKLCTCKKIVTSR